MCRGAAGAGGVMSGVEVTSMTLTRCRPHSVRRSSTFNGGGPEGHLLVLLLRIYLISEVRAVVNQRGSFLKLLPRLAGTDQPPALALILPAEFCW